MKKVLSFSQEQKSLIWKRFVQPEGGTEDEAKHFIEVCEMFGLNPLLNDIVFQRYETRQGPRTNFITTRDGLIRIASMHPDYVGAPVSNVVREGDEFEFLPSEGNVKHKFGKKRGGIIGAYAILKHRRFHPVSVFVDFEEYFKANARSQGGPSPIWDKMPSAMIQKVAEVFVLRRQFPLGGLYTVEEMGLDDIGNGDRGIESITPMPSQSVFQPENEREKMETKREYDKPSSKDSKQKKQQEEAETETEEEQATLSDETSSVTSNEQSRKYVLVKRESGISPSGIPFTKVQVKDASNDETLLVLAKGEEGVQLAEQIPEDQPFHMEVREENGFKFLESVNGHKAIAGVA
ncbi:phage recombination protein Bet [Planifilum fimeticola]|uniref:Phage recombination protein Bet n=1 Tax=Planifilum fimeticola TaxID=201975 RepID=A0A2T0LAP0_9BACL|nr:RecT family recombinase [Planifilum fimeticola]PRX38630.1 phage recombination protein Bet [Planifilum fimeticola]